MDESAEEHIWAKEERGKWALDKTILGISKRFERFKFGIFYVLIVKIRYNFTHK